MESTHHTPGTDYVFSSVMWAMITCHDPHHYTLHGARSEDLFIHLPSPLHCESLGAWVVFIHLRISNCQHSSQPIAGTRGCLLSEWTIAYMHLLQGQLTEQTKELKLRDAKPLTETTELDGGRAGRGIQASRLPVQCLHITAECLNFAFSEKCLIKTKAKMITRTSLILST